MNRKTSLCALKIHERITSRHILTRLEDLNQTQWLSQDELLTLQRDKLLSLVDYAMRYVPYYRRLFKQIDFHPDDLRRDLGNLNRIPILTKSIIRSNQEDMLTTEPERRRQLSRLCTSGSTGEPLIFMQDPDYRDAVTADIQRHMGWAGWTLGNSQAVIWGSDLHPNLVKRIRGRMIDWVWNRFQVNAFAITEHDLAEFTRKVLQRKPDVLFGYASGIHHFAQYIQRRADVKLTFKGIFTSAEKLVPPVRELIENTFDCKVFDRYGTFELGGLACECEAHHGLHISVENNYVEIIQDGRAAEPGEVGDIIVTNLNNRGMPFIRYAVGDAGALGSGENCPCGRKAPSLISIDGRIKDAFLTQDGRTVYTGFSGNAFRCLAQPEIRQFQVVQKTLDKILVRLVVDCEISQAVRDSITRAFQEMFGENMVVDFEFPVELPRLPSGKYQYEISELNRS